MKATFIIGNGFDLALGLPTRYADFIQSEFYKELIDNSNELAKHIMGQSTESNWSGIEDDLEKYIERNIYESYKKYTDNVAGDGSKKLDQLINNFDKNYQEIKKSLFNYLESLKVNPRSNPKKIQNFFNNKINSYKNLDVYNFNYTSFFNCFYSNEKINHIHVHGCIEAEINSIIFGVKNHQGIGKEFSFIKKEMHANYGTNFGQNKYIQDSIKENESIYFFGFSFGVQDSKIIRDIFAEDLSYKNITLISNTDNSIQNMKANINDIIGNNKFDTISHKLKAEIL
jgi:hypothetical protein